jgi:hypothetical protein
MPILDNIVLLVDSLDKGSLDEEGICQYLLIIGSLTYAIQGTRPDLAYAVSLCSRFLAKPIPKHIGIAKRVLRYLKGSTDLGITYHCDNTENLFVHTDFNY